jgi:hypothetical protein
VRVSVGSWQGVEVVRASEWVVAGVGTNLAKLEEPLEEGEEGGDLGRSRPRLLAPQAEGWHQEVYQIEVSGVASCLFGLPALSRQRFLSSFGAASRPCNEWNASDHYEYALAGRLYFSVQRARVARFWG